MQAVHDLSFYFHIAVGSIALLIFWIPVIARKGSLNHRRFGRYFALAMYAVSITGFIMASLDLAVPLANHIDADGLSQPELAQAIERTRLSALFLLSLSILVFASARQGWLAIVHQQDRSALRTPLHLSLCAALAGAGLLLLAVGLNYGSALFMIFGGLELFLGIGALRYNLKATLSNREWWGEHLGGMLGAGIGAHTAFFVFGGKRLLSEYLGGIYHDIDILLWVAPGVIGGIAINLLRRHYRKRFSTAAAAPTAAAISPARTPPSLSSAASLGSGLRQ